MQPPDTDPAMRPSSRTASHDPRGRGEAPQVAATVARTNAWPWRRQSWIAANTCRSRLSMLVPLEISDSLYQWPARQEKRQNPHTPLSEIHESPGECQEWRGCPRRHVFPPSCPLSTVIAQQAPCLSRHRLRQPLLCQPLPWPPLSCQPLSCQCLPCQRLPCQPLPCQRLPRPPLPRCALCPRPRASASCWRRAMGGATPRTPPVRTS